MSATRAVAEFVCSPPVMPTDSLAAALRSRTDTACAALLGSAVAVPGLPPAWTDAVWARSAGIDDVAVWGAAGAVLWPALTAVAGDAPAEDRLAEAFCVGVAVGEALWRSGRYREADRGFDGTSVFGTMAAAAACARYLGLSVDEVVAALGIAGSGTGGLIANLGTDLEPVHAGFAASNGVRAARLASVGFLGAPDILEARQGFAEAYFGPNWVTADELSAELAHALTSGDGVRLRQYPCHVEGQTLVAALIDAAHEHLIGDIDVTGIGPTSGAARFDVPTTAAEARASLRYVLALTLVHGTVSQAGLDPTSVDGKAALGAIDRVRVDVLSRWDLPQEPGLIFGGRPVRIPAPDDSLTTKWRRVCAELAEAGDDDTPAEIAGALAG
jgi:2-methylcitrate dehydratase PrpD